MESEDIPAVLTIQAASPEAARWTAQQYERACGKLGAYGTVVESQAGLLGFLTAQAALDELEILNLAVLQAYRRRGIATQLVSDVLAFGRACGVTQVYLEVRASNAGARAFYGRLGFAPAGCRRAYYTEPVEDALMLARKLTGDSL